MAVIVQSTPVSWLTSSVTTLFLLGPILEVVFLLLEGLLFSRGYAVPCTLQVSIAQLIFVTFLWYNCQIPENVSSSNWNYNSSFLGVRTNPRSDLVMSPKDIFIFYSHITNTLTLIEILIIRKKHTCLQKKLVFRFFSFLYNNKC